MVQLINLSCIWESLINASMIILIVIRMMMRMIMRRRMKILGVESDWLPDNGSGCSKAEVPTHHTIPSIPSIPSMPYYTIPSDHATAYHLTNTMLYGMHTIQHNTHAFLNHTIPTDANFSTSSVSTFLPFPDISSFFSPTEKTAS